MGQTITMYLNADTLGTDAQNPEVFAKYCEERLAREYPDAQIDVTIGSGEDSLPEGVSASELWEDYCSLPRSEYRRLALAVPAVRRGIYLAAIEATEGRTTS